MEILPAGKPRFNLHISGGKPFGKQSVQVQENLASAALYEEQRDLCEP